MGMNPSEEKRPPVRTALRPLIFITGCAAVLLVADKVFHQGAIAAVALFVIAVAYIAWYFLSYWHSQGWISLPKRRRSY
jgi:energy-coupling factor transporter transmembrane protein EcfT